MRRRGFPIAVLVPLVMSAATLAAEVRGVISKVDLDRHEVVLEGRGRGARGMTFTFTVDRDTKVLFGGQPAELADLSPGKAVRVSFDRQGKEDVAVLIQAHGRPPARTPAAPAPAPAPTASGDAITGTLQRVAYTEREIVVIGPGPKGPETETTIAVPAKVQVTRGDKTIAFDDLKEGEQVAVTAEKRDGKLSAVAIHAGGGKAPAPTNATKQERVQKVLQIVGQVLQVVQQMRANRRAPADP
jgi:Cu/Ag efflux protein CusF